jgi:hypothetical protein
MEGEPVYRPERDAEQVLGERLRTQLDVAEVTRRIANPIDGNPDQEAGKRAVKEAGAITHSVSTTLTEQARASRSLAAVEAQAKQWENPEEERRLRQREWFRRLRELTNQGMGQDAAERLLAEEDIARDLARERASAPSATPGQSEKGGKAEKEEAETGGTGPTGEGTIGRTPPKPRAIPDVKRTAEYWLRVGERVAGRLPMPLTCDLCAGLAVFVLTGLPAFRTLTVEVVQLLNKQMDNHFIVVVGRDPASKLDGDPATWGGGAFVVDVWGFLQNRCPLVAKPPSILASMSDPAAYPRSVMVSIGPGTA